MQRHSNIPRATSAQYKTLNNNIALIFQINNHCRSIPQRVVALARAALKKVEKFSFLWKGRKSNQKSRNQSPLLIWVSYFNSMWMTFKGYIVNAKNSIVQTLRKAEMSHIYAKNQPIKNNSFLILLYVPDRRCGNRKP